MRICEASSFESWMRWAPEQISWPRMNMSYEFERSGSAGEGMVYAGRIARGNWSRV